MFGPFIREMPESVDKNKTWQCLSKFNVILRLGHAEALLCGTQEQAIRTNYVKALHCQDQ